MYLLNNRRKWIVRRRPEGATVPMSECDIQVETSVQYTGTARFPSVSVSFGGEPLVLDVDYALTYRDNVEVGNGTVSVTGLGNFVGSVVKTFAVVGSGGGGTHGPWGGFQFGDGRTTLVASGRPPVDDDYGVSPTMVNLQILPNGNISFLGTMSTSAGTVRRVYEMGFRNGRMFSVDSAYYVRRRPVPEVTPAASSIVFSDSGLDAVVLEGAKLKSFTMSEPFDTSTASGLYDGGVGSENTPFFSFLSGGSSIFYKGNPNPWVSSLDLLENWKLSSHGNPSLRAMVSLTERTGSGLSWRNAFFSPDGASVVVSSGSGRADVHRFDMSTPWDVMTMSRTSYETIIDISQNVVVDAIAVGLGGTKMILHDANANILYEYSLS